MHTEANKPLLEFSKGSHETRRKEIPWQHAHRLPRDRNGALRRTSLESSAPVRIKSEI